MILAAVSFSDPLMLAGLLAAGIPVALHLLNRIRSPIVPFPTLRFLKITAQKTSRRRQVQQYLLLLLRMAVFAMIAMAAAHPLIRGGSAALAYTFIAMFLGGMGLLAAGTMWGSAAIAGSKNRSAAATLSTAAAPASGRSSGAKSYWGLSTAAFFLAVVMAGYAVFGLTSSRYFSGDKGEFSGRSTAAVIIFDNSHSMLVKDDGQTRLERARSQAHRLLAETIRPAEAAILPSNPGGAPSAESLTGDMTGLVGSLDALWPGGRARSMKERIHTAIDLLTQSGEANKMLVIVSDFAKPAVSDAEMFRALKTAPGGAGKDIQLVLMPMGAGSVPADVGIESFGIAEGGTAAVAGGEVTFEARILNNGDGAAVKDLELLADGKVVNAGGDGVPLRVQLGPAGTVGARSTVKLSCHLDAPGYHVFSLRLADDADAMAWDNQRSLVIHVADAVKVLVIGSEPASHGPRSRSAAFYLRAALEPFAGSTMKGADGKPMAWPLKTTYRGAGEVTAFSAITGYAAIFVCDVPRVSTQLADALAEYLKGDASARLIWVLGPSVDGAAYNQALVGRHLLPAPLGTPLVAAAGATIDWVDLQSDIFANLFDNQEPFRAVVVTGRWSIGGEGGGRPLIKLTDGTVLLTQHNSAAGSGDVYTLLTSPSAAWSNLGSTVVIVPMASRLAMGDSGRRKTPTSYACGDHVLIQIPGTAKPPARMTLDVTMPNKEVVNVRPIGVDDAMQWYFDTTLNDGIYQWRSTDGKWAGAFAVNPPAEEVELTPADARALADEANLASGAVAGRAAIVASTADELSVQLQKRSEGTTLAPGILGMVLILAVLEAFLANRYCPGGQGESADDKSRSPLIHDFNSHYKSTA